MNDRCSSYEDSEVPLTDRTVRDIEYRLSMRDVSKARAAEFEREAPEDIAFLIARIEFLEKFVDDLREREDEASTAAADVENILSDAIAKRCDGGALLALSLAKTKPDGVRT